MAGSPSDATASEHEYRTEVRALLGVVAFVGGSLVPVGGHNVLEPARAGELLERANKREAELLRLDKEADAAVKTARPQSTTGRRPKLSDSAPWNRFMKAKPNR